MAFLPVGADLDLHVDASGNVILEDAMMHLPAPPLTASRATSRMNARSRLGGAGSKV